MLGRTLRYLALILLACAAVGLVVGGPAVWAMVNRQQGGAPSVGSGHTVRQPSGLTNGLVGWWRLDGDVLDSSSKGNDGTLSGSSYSVVPGKFGTAYNFAAADNYINVGDPANGSLNVGTSFSFGGWFNTSATNKQLMNKSWDVLIGGGSIAGDVQCRYGSGNSTAIWSGTNDGKWHHVLCVANASDNTIRIYGDGVERGTAVTASVNGSNTTPLYLGARYNPATYYTGSLDDLRIYNRALSAAEVSQLYAGSQPIACDQTCVAWWKLDEASGTSAADATGNGHTGTLTGFTASGNAGVFGNALQFDGSTSRLDVGTLPTTSAMTATAWVNMSSSMTAFGRVFGTTNNGLAIGVYPNGQYSGSIVDGSGQYSSAGSGANTISAGSWYLMALTVNGTDLRVYVNGVLKGQVTASFSLSGGTSTDAIGTVPGSASQIFNGTIDDVRVYNRALEPYEIYEMYSAGR